MSDTLAISRFADQVDVPCNGCVLCCVRQRVPLIDGDDPADYAHHAETFGDVTLNVLDHKPDGSCVYLGPDGCTIHGRAPKVCREFDCRGAYLMHDRHERRRRVRLKLADPRVYEAGRARVGSLR